MKAAISISRCYNGIVLSWGVFPLHAFLLKKPGETTLPGFKREYKNICSLRKKAKFGRLTAFYDSF